MLTRRQALAGLAAFAAGPALAEEPAGRSARDLMDALMWGKEPVGGPFSLTDHTGVRRTEKDYRGKLVLLYFGFSYCPDICPGDLLSIATAIRDFGERGEQIQPLFVTLDPERDTVSHLAGYVPLFHPRLVGLTGTAEEIRAVAEAYKVVHQKVPTTDGNYTVDHSAFIYLLDRDGRYLGFFPPSTPSARMTQIVEPHLRDRRSVE